VIVGSDDRREVYELADELAPLARATAALAHAHILLFRGATGLTLVALPASRALELCPGERFADQPAAAFCSAVLIDDTLAVTAGHCLGSDLERARAVCAEMRVVFGFELTGPGAAVVLDADDVFSCRRVVLLQRDPGDFAVIELDRPATPGRQPVTAGALRPQAGDRLVVGGSIEPARKPRKNASQQRIRFERIGGPSTRARSPSPAPNRWA
jgi:hypothetical protein